MKKESDFKNILVYRIGHLGDTIVALPAFWEIRKRFPKSNLTLLTNTDGKNKNYATAKNILPETGLFDSYIAYDNSAQSIGKIVTFARLFFEIRKRKIDRLYYLSTRNRTDQQIDRDLTFFKSAGIKEIFGAELVRENQLDFSEPKPLPVIEPEYRFLLKCVDKSLQTSNIDCDLKLKKSEKEFVQNWLEKKCGENFENKKLFAVAPGSKWQSKLWFKKNYLDVIKKLIEKYDVYPVIFGGKKHFETGQEILSELKTGANSAGFFSIRESAAALEKCRFYLGNDTGTMHLAATVGTPCVAVFAATDYQGRWYPFGEKNRIFRKTVECEGCHTPDCFNDHKCLKLVTSDEVFTACQELLESE